MNQNPVAIELNNLGAEQNGAARQNPARERRPRLEILFEGDLPPHYSGINLPIELAEKRNLTIKALGIHLVAIIAGFAFYFVRRV